MVLYYYNDGTGMPDTSDNSPLNLCPFLESSPVAPQQYQYPDLRADSARIPVFGRGQRQSAAQNPQLVTRGGVSHPVGAGQSQTRSLAAQPGSQGRPGVGQDLLPLHQSQVRILLLQALHVQVLPTLRLFQLYHQGILPGYHRLQEFRRFFKESLFGYS